MGERAGFILPLLYALLPDKSEETYDRLFSQIKQIFPNLRPTSVSVDYEKAILNSLKKALPGISIGGCLFHLNKNLKKHLMQEGLKVSKPSRYRESSQRIR